MEIPTYNCYIYGETDETYLIEVDCRCGKTHKHGLPKDEVNKQSHRVAHCDKFTDGYYMLLTKQELDKWKKN